MHVKKYIYSVTVVMKVRSYTFPTRVALGRTEITKNIDGINTTQHKVLMHILIS